MSYLHQAHSKHWQLANQNKCQTRATTEPATIADTTHTFPPKSSSPMKPMEAATVVQAIPRKPSFLHASVLVPRQHEQPQPLGGGLRRQPIQLHERLNQLAEAVLARVHIGRVAVFRTEQGNQPLLACGNVIVLLGLICAVRCVSHASTSTTDLHERASLLIQSARRPISASHSATSSICAWREKRDKISKQREMLRGETVYRQPFRQFAPAYLLGRGAWRLVVVHQRIRRLLPFYRLPQFIFQARAGFLGWRLRGLVVAVVE